MILRSLGFRQDRDLSIHSTFFNPVENPHETNVAIQSATTSLICSSLKAYCYPFNGDLYKPEKIFQKRGLERPKAKVFIVTIVEGKAADSFGRSGVSQQQRHRFRTKYNKL